MAEYESVLLVKSEVFVYKIPPRTSNRGYRAADWNLAEPTWTGRMRLVAKGVQLSLKLEDKASGALYANCPIDTYPGIALESVNDSSRYFVLRIQDDNGRQAFIGLGFGDRSDSFDLNVALQDHFKWLKNQEQIEKEKIEPKQELQLGLKEGETIKINMKITKRDGSDMAQRVRPKAGANAGVLPPPPSGVKSASSSQRHIAQCPATTTEAAPSAQTTTEWGEFESAKDPSSISNASWVQF